MRVRDLRAPTRRQEGHAGCRGDLELDLACSAGGDDARGDTGIQGDVMIVPATAMIVLGATTKTRTSGATIVGMFALFDSGSHH